MSNMQRRNVDAGGSHPPPYYNHPNENAIMPVPVLVPVLPLSRVPNHQTQTNQMRVMQLATVFRKTKFLLLLAFVLWIMICFVYISFFSAARVTVDQAGLASGLLTVATTPTTDTTPTRSEVAEFMNDTDNGNGKGKTTTMTMIPIMERAVLENSTDNLLDNNQRVQHHSSHANTSNPNSSELATLNTRNNGSTPHLELRLTLNSTLDNQTDLSSNDGKTTSNVTIVTAYFVLGSMFDNSYYRGWVKNMLSLKDAMVIFTAPESVAELTTYRAHAPNRTVIIPVPVDDLPMANMFPTAFWEKQLSIDPERNIHETYRLYWFWLSKSWFVTQAIRRNFFHSTMFVWSDISSFRGNQYNGHTLVQQIHHIPRQAILTMAHSDPNPPKDLFWNNKLGTPQHFYTSGTVMAGYTDTWDAFHALFLDTLQGFARRNMFLGEDQVVLQSTCRQYPSYCAYSHPAEIVGWNVWLAKKKEGTLDHLNEIRWFGLQKVLSDSSQYTYWYHPPLTSNEAEQIGLKWNATSSLPSPLWEKYVSNKANPLKASSLSDLINKTTSTTEWYNETGIVKPASSIAVYSATVVTAYFPVEANLNASYFSDWIKNMLSLQDAMVIFTSSESLPRVLSMRSHALNRTVIIPISAENLPVAAMFTKTFWEKQLAADKERDSHRSYRVFWVWLSKSWFVTQAVARNYFQSSVFVWSEIHCFRSHNYNGRTLVEHGDQLPKHALVAMSHSDPNPPKDLYWNDKLGDPEHFYHSGALVAGECDTWKQFHVWFLETLWGFTKLNMFIGEEQPIWQSTCRQHPSICAYLHPMDIVGRKEWTERKRLGRLEDINDVRWFGIRDFLSVGGNHTFWYPPPLRKEEADELTRLLPTDMTTDESTIPHYRMHREPLQGLPSFVADRLVELLTVNRTEIVKPFPTAAESNVTIVTAYFAVSSKHGISHYAEWMQNMLSLQDAMVIFTSPEWVQRVKSYRSHALNRTAIVPMTIENLPIARMFSTKYWENQLAIDREGAHHKSYKLFWIWLSKSWFVTRAIERNFFKSTIYIWSDIGCFRWNKYGGRTLAQHPEVIPRRAILHMAHSDPNPPKRLFWDDKLGTPEHFYHAGALAAGYSDTWENFHNFFLETIGGFAQRNLFIGEDQAVLQSTCRQHPSICAYAHPADILGWDNWLAKKQEGKLDDFNEIRWFGLQNVLHEAGNYTLWNPPPLTDAESIELGLSGANFSATSYVGASQFSEVEGGKIECWSFVDRCALKKNETMNVNSTVPSIAVMQDLSMKTLALSDPLLRDGYRNQFMRFVVFTVYAIKNGFQRMLLPSIRWNCDHRKVKFDSVPFELLFDVDHWNEDSDLPRLVAFNQSEHQDWDPYTGLFRGACDVLDYYLKDPGDGKNAIFNRTKHYLNPVPYGGGGGLGTLFYDYFGYDRQRQNVYSPILNKTMDFSDVEARIIRAMRPSTTVERLLRQSLGSNGEPPYIALHARIEPEMLIHPRCLDKKVYNLTTIFDMIRGMAHVNLSNPSLYIAIGLPEMEEGNPFPEFQMEHKLNMEALRDALAFGLDLPSGETLKVSAGAHGAIKSDIVATCANEIVSAVISFEIAVRARIFIGTYISTWSTTVWKARHALGLGGNFAYTPYGLANVTGSTPLFEC